VCACVLSDRPVCMGVWRIINSAQGIYVHRHEVLTCVQQTIQRLPEAVPSEWVRQPTEHALARMLAPSSHYS
jgi:hypothetical protein